jgi:hypothetical protein
MNGKGFGSGFGIPDTPSWDLPGGPEKTHKKEFSQNSQSPGQDSDGALSEQCKDGDNVVTPLMSISKTLMERFLNSARMETM